VEWELAQYELGMIAPRRTKEKLAEIAERWPDGPLAPHPMVRVAAFHHDPAVILQRAFRRDPLPWDGVATGEFYLLLDAREGREVIPMDVDTGRALLAIQNGAPVPDEHRDEFLAEGLLVRTAPAGDAAVEADAEMAGAA
jgi:hypothetical protein